MAGATFDRVKNWGVEVLSNTDLNIEIDNILNNFNPDGMDDYSADIAQMRKMTDPGEVGSESLATSLAGEIERLRHEIKEIKGGDVTNWYEAASSSLSDLRQLVGGTTSSTRISSGRTTGRSSQLNVIVPDGTNDGLHIEGSPTNFIYYIDDVQYTIEDDTVLIDGLVKAPSTNNTCLVNDGLAAGGNPTKILGEFGTVISVDNMGSNITALVGKVAGFKIVSAGLTEYFTAYVESSTKLRQATRGGFFDSASAAKPRIAFSDNDTITLMKLTWIFLTSAKGILVTYNEPVYAATAPDSPATGDFWFDMTNQVWKRFDGATYTQIAVALIGTSLQDATNCVAARTLTRFANQLDTNTVDLEWVSNGAVRMKNYGAQLAVFGTLNRFETSRLEWNMAAHLDTGITEASSTVYYLYMKETGAPVISDQAPHDHRADLRGFYHPFETWRYVGKITNDASSNFDANSLVVPFRTKELRFFSNEFNAVGTMKMQGSSLLEPGWAKMDGTLVSRYLYNELYESGLIPIGTAYGNSTGTAYGFNLPYSQGMFMRGFSNATGSDPEAASRTALQAGGATGDAIGSFQNDQFQGHNHRISYLNNVGSNPGLADSLTDSYNESRDGAVTIPVNNGSHGEPRYGLETRPRNIGVQFVIKVLP